MFACTRTLPCLRVVILLLFLQCAACQTWRTERVAAESLLAARQPKLRITLVHGGQFVLEHPLLRGDTLSSPMPGLKDLRIPLTGVREVATRRISVSRTVGLAVGVAAAVGIASLAVRLSGNRNTDRCNFYDACYLE